MTEEPTTAAMHKDFTAEEWAEYKIADLERDLEAQLMQALQNNRWQLVGHPAYKIYSGTPAYRRVEITCRFRLG